MTISPRLKALAFLSTPMVLIFVAQNLLGMITTLLVGHLGDAALAGVGIAGAIFSILLGLLTGLDTAVQAIVARRTGAGDQGGAGAALAQGLVLCGWVGAVLTVVAYFAAPALLAMAIKDPAAVAAGTAFLHGYSPILLVLGFNMTFSAYWYGVGAPRYALAVTAIQTPIHGAISYLLAFGGLGLPALGPFGAGLGATLAAVLALGLNLVAALKIAPIKGLRGARGDMAALVRIGLPLSLQQSLFSLSMAVAFAVIAQIGTAAAAAANVINNLATLVVLAACAIGTATATFVGEALGRGQEQDARRWGWEGTGFAAVALAPFAVALFLAPEWALRLFITNPDTVAMAVGPTRILALSMTFDTCVRLLTYGLRGAGATTAPSAVAFGFQWLVQLPLSWWVGVKLGWGLEGALAVILARDVAEAAVLAWLWRGRSWTRVRIGSSAPVAAADLSAAQPAG